MFPTKDPQTQLKTIIQKIDTALIPDGEKEKLFEAVLTAIQGTVWPLVVKHMPAEKVDAVTANPDSLTVDSYVDLIDQAMTDGTASDEIEPALVELFAKVEGILKEKNIA